jgi:hypothetical protein
LRSTDCGSPDFFDHQLAVPAMIEQIPLSSADSAMVAHNVNHDSKWSGTFARRTKPRGPSLCDGVEAVSGRLQMDLELEAVGNC